MAGKHDSDRRFEGGAEYVDEEAGDTPRPGRGAKLLLVAILGLLALLMPVAWGIGVLATIGTTVGTGALVALWIVWGIIVLLFLWSAWSIWRRAA